MPRVPYISREQLPEEKRPLYDRMKAARGGNLPRVFELFLNAPDLAALISETGAYARFQTQIPDDAREIAILSAARELDCHYEFTHHVPLARKAGVREHVIEGINNRSTRGMQPKESVFVDYARQVVRNRVNDPTFAAVEHLLGRQGAVELTMVIGYYAMASQVMLALGIELEQGVESLMKTQERT